MGKEKGKEGTKQEEKGKEERMEIRSQKQGEMPKAKLEIKSQRSKGRIRIKTIRTSRRTRQPYSAAHLEQNSNRPGFLKIMKIMKTEHFQR